MMPHSVENHCSVTCHCKRFSVTFQQRNVLHVLNRSYSLHCFMTVSNACTIANFKREYNDDEIM